MARSSKALPITRVVSGTTLFIVLVLISLVFAGHAFADAGGWPTATPTMTPTQTPTNTPPPTLTPIITATNLIGDTPQPPVSTAKVLPTGTLLSQDELLQTLEAVQQPPADGGENERPAFWWYILILFGVSAAVVVIVLFGLLRQGRKQPAEGEPESEDNPTE